MSDGGVAGVADMCWGGVGDSAPLNCSGSGSGADWKANDGRAGVSAGLIQTSVTGPFVRSTRCSTAVDQPGGGWKGERGREGKHISAALTRSESGSTLFLNNTKYSVAG